MPSSIQDKWERTGLHQTGCQDQVMGTRLHQIGTRQLSPDMHQTRFTRHPVLWITILKYSRLSTRTPGRASCSVGLKISTSTPSCHIWTNISDVPCDGIGHGWRNHRGGNRLCNWTLSSFSHSSWFLQRPFGGAGVRV